MGKAALPALHEAEKSSDSEIHERVEDLLSDLQAPQIPRDLPEAPVHGNSGFNGSFVRSENRGGTQTVDAIENGRSIHIERSNRGVRMTVHGELHGAPVTREYKAASPEELKEANPRAYKLYVDCLEMVTSVSAPNWGNQPPGVRPFILPNGRAILPILPPPRVQVQPIPDQDLDRLQGQLFNQMAQAQLTPLQRNEVLDLLRQLRSVRVPANNPAEQNRLMEEYNRRSDALRKQLRALHLPDPGDALPPPDNARLGISISEGPSGLLVTHVLPNSRAEALGIRVDDVIQ